VLCNPGQNFRFGPRWQPVTLLVNNRTCWNFYKFKGTCPCPPHCTVIIIHCHTGPYKPCQILEHLGKKSMNYFTKSYAVSGWEARHMWIIELWLCSELCFDVYLCCFVVLALVEEPRRSWYVLTQNYLLY